MKDPRTRTFLLIALHTERCQGEILGLMWEDIDFGQRDLPLTDELEKWLLKRKQTSRSKSVLTMKNGKPLTQSAYKSMWNLVERNLPNTHVTARILWHPNVKPKTQIVSNIVKIPGH